MKRRRDELGRFLKRELRVLRGRSQYFWPTSRVKTHQRAAADYFRALHARGEIPYEPATCPCGDTAAESTLVCDRERHGIWSPHYLCHACGIIRISPRIAEPWLPTFYEEHYSAIYRDSPEPTFEFFQSQVAHGESIKQWCNQNSYGPSVADFGCGSGGALVAFENANLTCGCDLDPKYVNYGLKQNLSLVHGDESALIDFAPFDFVILSHVVEHLPDPREFFRSRLRPLVREEGLVYVETPGLLSIPVTWGDPLDYFQNAHLFNFTLSSLTSVMAQEGFTLVKGDESIRALFRLSKVQPGGGLELGGARNVARALAVGNRLRHFQNYWHHVATSRFFSRFRKTPLWAKMREVKHS